MRRFAEAQLTRCPPGLQEEYAMLRGEYMTEGKVT